MLLHMIYTYIQLTVLATKSIHIKVPSQVSPIDSFVFKQQKTMSMGHKEKTILWKIIDLKENYQKSSYSSDVPSKAYLPPPPSRSI